MTTSVFHLAVTFPCKNGLPKDTAENTFTFVTDGAADIDLFINNFYNAIPAGGTNALAHYISTDRDRSTNACTIKYYDVTAHLNGSPAGPPVAESHFTLAAGASSTNLPDEVAVALSFHGADDTIPEFAPGARPRARHRGRVFIGPLQTSGVQVEDGSDVLRVGTTLRTDLALAGTALRNAMHAVGSPNEWVVWSRRNAATYPVIGGWVDDAFDTIRGRGPEPTTRTFMTPPV